MDDPEISEVSVDEVEEEETGEPGAQDTTVRELQRRARLKDDIEVTVAKATSMSGPVMEYRLNPAELKALRRRR